MPYPIDKKTLIGCFIGLFLFESFLAIWTGLPYDMKIWFQTGLWMNQGINIYIPPNHLGYPPLWALWCAAAYKVYLFFGNNTQVWNFTIKLPLIISHILLTSFAGKFAAQRFDHKTGRRVFFYVLTGSFFIYIAALWGQINIISALLTFLAFYTILKNRITTSAFLLGIAVTLKIYPVITLPVFLAFVLRKSGKRQAGKFALITIAVPTLFTLTVFAAYRWDILYFLKTIFYWSPVFESNPVQITSGCMNIWSFVALFNVNMGGLWILRMIWIPVLFLGAIYWLRKTKLDDGDLNLALISLYVLFMITYGWVTEQTFLDPLPFILLQVLAYRPKKSSLYFLVIVQILVYLFSLSNWGGFIFQPLLQQFAPGLLPLLKYSDPTTSAMNWIIRGRLGLAVSIALGVFLVILAEPTSFKRLVMKKNKPVSPKASDIYSLNIDRRS